MKNILKFDVNLKKIIVYFFLLLIAPPVPKLLTSKIFKIEAAVLIVGLFLLLFIQKRKKIKFQKSFLKIFYFYFALLLYGVFLGVLYNNDFYVILKDFFFFSVPFFTFFC
ncbi:hypothetical protein TTHT_1945 [Thermotomaculum hydrothermale]|uniref:Uncharacterized protein n=1 Tax=Thermotomaculum hydrothermale TaxID=981385 RepID=A0A7R6PQC8_9BACT|nr:hypothetical protein [Thermotomaculum hydrothermale]BBB33396.1 hypothetical protein TTHT_1945 [Thermotomaculum hydrothermale]